MSLLDDLRTLVAEELGVEEKAVKPESSFIKDLGADSLDLIQLILSLEKHWGIEIPDDDAEKLVTVQDVLDYLKEKGIV